jgi:hypothetical protein
MEQKIEGYEDWLPRTEKVPIGDKVLTVKELSIAKRDAVVKVLFRGVNVAQLLGPLMEAARIQNDEIRVNLGDLIAQLKDVLFGLLTSDLGKVVCIALDTEENRGLAGFGGESVVTDPDTGIEHSEGMHKWVKDNTNIRQESRFLEAFMRVNDFVGLIKNYKSLVASSLTATGVTESETVSLSV